MVMSSDRTGDLFKAAGLAAADVTGNASPAFNPTTQYSVAAVKDETLG